MAVGRRSNKSGIKRSRGKKARRRAYFLGRLAETSAVWMLRLKGYRILARGFRRPVGEIDILARRGQVLAAVEVKRRARLSSAAEAVTPRQRRRIANALSAYLAGRPDLAGLDARFDVVLLAPRHLPLHIPDAWRMD